ncbi:bifunctional EF-G domain III-V-like/P-loop containing nucleoside triphosphate hydrolase/Translation protein [Babesia duncani]|uniref:Bifunctional EF-G domain III-V-like/P-loop containing nucleoside triphosphate hydrolase/Translation protein n=1 Tax=Babesia duncani TaxID=323732 RepID=A0AAD9PMZ2_9APIC|nr:bifunctional EF-G domain III-V-like/P-loop containing nucleoside triphosphate hydrolase/Translation protein [Babesia duncani]
MWNFSNVLGFTENIRNVCFLAHVDHGKTTLSDSLISSVGIISERLSGKLRYLDNRDDEQQRMITIKSSSISLLYSTSKHSATSKNNAVRDCLINLVDSPGHVDFAIEVSTAARLCDGALLIVDVVEGICPQTKAVLRQAWHEGVKSILVMNKIDRLIVDLHMTPSEAYKRLRDLVEQANALMHQLYLEDVCKDEDCDVNVVLSDEEKLFYNPANGTVIFVSAVHRWCINIQDFAIQVAKKLNIPETKVGALEKALWGEFYFDAKTKSVRPIRNNEKPLFVQFVLEQLWGVYDSILISWNPPAIKKYLRYLNVDLTHRHAQMLTGGDVQADEDREDILLFLMSIWLPLAMGIVDVIINCLPSPVVTVRERLKRICPAIVKYRHFSNLSDATCDFPTVVHVAKYLGCDLRLMRLTGDVLHGDESAGEFVAFSRIFTGCIRAGDSLYICENSKIGRTNKDSLFDSEEHRKRVTVKRVMILMGADLVDIEAAWPGNIVALVLSQHESSIELGAESLWGHNVHIHNHVKAVMAWILSLGDPHRSRVQNIEEYTDNRNFRNRSLCSVDRHLTLSSDSEFPAFPSLTCKLNNSIIRVSVEPQNVKDVHKLLLGLALLYISDPAVELEVLKTGEYILACCGEIHLERCLNDLGNLYSKVPINVSPPRVSIREGLVNLTPSYTAQLSHSNALSRRVNFPPWKNKDASYTSELNDPEIETWADKKDYIPILGFPGVYMTVESKMLGTEYVPFPGNDGVVLVRGLQMPNGVLEFLDTWSEEIRLLLTNETLNSSKLQLETVESGIYKAWYKHKTGSNDIPNESLDVGHLWAISAHRGTRCLLYYNDNNGLRVVTRDGTMMRPRPLEWKFMNYYTRCNSSVNKEEYQLITSIYSGFEIACQNGPLADEPLRGVVFIIEGLYIPDNNPHTYMDLDGNNIDSDCCKTPLNMSIGHAFSRESGTNMDTYRNDHYKDVMTLSSKHSEVCTIHSSSKFSTSTGTSAGKIISSMRAVTVIPRYRTSLEIHCDQSVLGRVYSVLQKRHTRILSENVRNGTSMFVIDGLIPAADSFGLEQDLRSKASGACSFHLQYSNWELIAEDPFPEVSMTDEDLEDDGFNLSLMVQSNVPRKLINHVRKLKVEFYRVHNVQGLVTEHKVVENAEKQRTLSTKR